MLNNKIRPDLKVLIIKDYPSREELAARQGFYGTTQNYLEQALQAAGTTSGNCSFAFMFNYNFYCEDKSYSAPCSKMLAARANIKTLIETLKPDLIIGLGAPVLWALTGNIQITKWRGSQLYYNGIRFLPTYSPNALLSRYDWLFILKRDMQRAFSPWEVPVRASIIRPTFTEALTYLDELLAINSPQLVAIDIETRRNHIACVGLAKDLKTAICIPFMCVENSDGYWTESEEIQVVAKIRACFRNPNLQWVLQNGLFDSQYFYWRWGLIPKVEMDTMLAHHTLFSGLPKGLDFLASLYCKHYVYWKDDGKHFDLEHHSEDRLWSYNCDDVFYTLEIAHYLQDLIVKSEQLEPYQFQMAQFPVILQMMLRGVRINTAYQAELDRQLTQTAKDANRWLAKVLGHEVNIKSPKQMQDLFYRELGLEPQMQRKRKTVSTDKEALASIAKKMPLLKPVVEMIEDLRSVGVFKSTFVQMPLSEDNRMRCSYNVAGTETFRYSSSRNAFGTGGNLQNLPKGKNKPGRLALPNIRSMFIPDDGYFIVDVDLDRADAQVVAWEAGAEKLKDLFRQGVDIHTENAKAIFGVTNVDGKSRYRALAKAGVHATNYGASARTLAIALGITVKEAERFQDRWFSIHPEIRDWHRRIENQVVTHKAVYNAFGYRRVYFDRPNNILPEALAWIPQSTVALVIDKGLVNLANNRPDIMPLLQVHDSIVFQAPLTYLANLEEFKNEIRKELSIVVPYQDPLIIGVGFECAQESWGHVR